jgi:hypothetical protein
MPCEVALIAGTSINFSTFLASTQAATGRSIAAASDESLRQLSVTERWLSCLAALDDQAAQPGLPGWLLRHASFSFLVAVDNENVTNVLAVSAGMAVVASETIEQGLTLLVLTGTLQQWRDAILEGSWLEAYSKIQSVFEQRNLGGLFK